MKIKPFLGALVAALLLCGCGKVEPIQKEHVERGDVTVERLVEWDDCVLYRVRFYYVYVAKCGGSTRTQWDEPQGKTTSTRSVETVRGGAD